MCYTQCLRVHSIVTLAAALEATAYPLAACHASATAWEYTGHARDARHCQAKGMCRHSSAGQLHTCQAGGRNSRSVQAGGPPPPPQPPWLGAASTACLVAKTANLQHDALKSQHVNSPGSSCIAAGCLPVLACRVVGSVYGLCNSLMTTAAPFYYMAAMTELMLMLWP